MHPASNAADGEGKKHQAVAWRRRILAAVSSIQYPVSSSQCHFLGCERLARGGRTLLSLLGGWSQGDEERQEYLLFCQL